MSGFLWKVLKLILDSLTLIFLVGSLTSWWNNAILGVWKIVKCWNYMISFCGFISIIGTKLLQKLFRIHHLMSDLLSNVLPCDMYTENNLGHTIADNYFFVRFVTVDMIARFCPIHWFSCWNIIIYIYILILYKKWIQSMKNIAWSPFHHLQFYMKSKLLPTTGFSLLGNLLLIPLWTIIWKKPQTHLLMQLKFRYESKVFLFRKIINGVHLCVSLGLMHLNVIAIQIDLIFFFYCFDSLSLLSDMEIIPCNVGHFVIQTFSACLYVANPYSYIFVDSCNANN